MPLHSTGVGSCGSLGSPGVTQGPNTTSGSQRLSSSLLGPWRVAAVWGSVMAVSVVAQGFEGRR
jgi:hypothetical protein